MAPSSYKSRMEQDFFTNLPLDITIDILSRLPVGATVRCKCVSKSWLDLLETPEFVKSHFSKSLPGLVVFQRERSSEQYEVYEFVDELDPEYSKRNCSLAFNFSFPHHELIHSSAHGLLLLFNFHITLPPSLYVCNPITRDYITLPQPPSSNQLDTFGFGVSKVSGQFKVVRIFHDSLYHEGWNDWTVLAQSVCQVYSLGTGSWRSIAGSGAFKYEWRTIGAFLNGNCHWLVHDMEGSHSLQISCFDLETEHFSTLSPPPHLHGRSSRSRSLSALRDRLCLCDTSSEEETVFWSMSSYGDDKSWTKMFVISGSSLHCYGVVCPIKIFKDGDILMASVGWCRLLCYSSKTKTIEMTNLIEYYGYDYRSSAVSYTPSLLSLKTFTMENVSSF